MAIFEPYESVMAVLGLALLITTLAIGWLNRLHFPKFFVYLPAGILAGPYVFGLAPDDPLEGLEVLERVAEFTVIVSLLVAGMKISRPLRWRDWRSTMRLILLVMPLSILAFAVTGHLLLGLALGPAILLGAILAPTDPVLAGAVQQDGPGDDDELRFGLTSEAGLNDGFAFPFVYLGLYLTLRLDEWPGLGAYWLLKDLLYGVALALPAGWLLGHVGGRWFLKMAEKERVSNERRELVPLALLLGVYGLVELLGAYGFLAAFTTGLGFRRAIEDKHEELATFTNFSESVEALGEAAAILVLGALLPVAAMLGLGWVGAAFALVTLLLLRPIIVLASTVRSGFSRTERGYWAWFGIRGIGSLYYLSYAVTFGLPDDLALKLFAATVVVVLASNLLHGTTVYPLMRRVRERELIHP